MTDRAVHVNSGAAARWGVASVALFGIVDDLRVTSGCGGVVVHEGHVRLAGLPAP